MRGINDKRSLARTFSLPIVAVFVDPECPGLGIARVLLVEHGRDAKELPAAGGSLPGNRSIEDDQVELALVQNRRVRRGEQSKFIQEGGPGGHAAEEVMD